MLVVVSKQAPVQAATQDLQYHFQTDVGPLRFFRFLSKSGQFRKEILHPDGSQEGSFGWLDPNGLLRVTNYIADSKGYRILGEKVVDVGQNFIDYVHGNQDIKRRR